MGNYFTKNNITSDNLIDASGAIIKNDDFPEEAVTENVGIVEKELLISEEADGALIYNEEIAEKDTEKVVEEQLETSERIAEKDTEKVVEEQLETSERIAEKDTKKVVEESSSPSQFRKSPKHKKKKIKIH
jgi:hypothetical protein